MKILRIKGLQHIIEYPELGSLDYRLLVLPCRQHDDRNCRAVLHGTDLFQSLNAIHQRHLDIQQNQIRLFLIQIADRSGAGVYRNYFILVFQLLFDCGKIDNIIIHRQDTHFFFHLFYSSLSSHSISWFSNSSALSSSYIFNCCSISCSFSFSSKSSW